MANCAIAIKLVELDGDDTLVGPVPGASVKIQPNRPKDHGADEILTPNELTEAFEDGTLTVVVPPDDAETATRFKFDGFAGSYELSGWYQIPDVASVNFRDLDKVDPETFAPLPGPAPAWAAPVAALEAGLDAEVAAARNADNLTSGTIPDARIPSTITRDTELAAAVSAAVDALVAGAPGALDTLAELADAIGDDADFAASVTTALAGKASAAGLATEITDRTTADAAIVTSIDTKVADAAEVQMAGLELGFAERITNFTTTSVGLGSFITGLEVTVIGQGRPVDIEFFCSAVRHSVASTQVCCYLDVNGSGAVAQSQSVNVSSPSTTAGRSAFLRRRAVLADGVSYTFKVGVFGLAAGTCTLNGSAAGAMELSVTSR